MANDDPDFLVMMRRERAHSVSKNSGEPGPVPRVSLGDARHLPVRNSSIDLVVTSPPYLNAIDYIRCSKFSLVWMGYRIPDLRELRAASVGCESAKSSSDSDEEIRELIAALKMKPKLSSRDEGVLAHYIDDMLSAMREVKRVLAPGGKAVYVVGENTVRGTFIRTSKIICEIASLSGLKLKERRVRNLPANRRYLPPPSYHKSASMDVRMRREVVLVFINPKLRRSNKRFSVNGL